RPDGIPACRRVLWRLRGASAPRIAIHLERDCRIRTSLKNWRSHHQAPPKGLHWSGVLQRLRSRRQATNTVRGGRMSALSRITEELSKLQRAGFIEAFHTDDSFRERTWIIQINS